MSAEPKLSSLTRSKLSLSVSNRDSLSLHRWVLLKNSILHSPVTPAQQHTDNDSLSASEPLDDSDADADTDTDTDTDAEAEEDETTTATAVAVLSSFMFPDAGKFASSDAARHSEEQWLDSLLETLGDDSDDDDDDEEDEDEFTGPHCVDDYNLSPMSSSDDLHHPHPHHSHHPGDRPPSTAASAFYSPSDSISVPYTMPYLVPHCDQDDLLDTIDDTSDDESDAPATPSLGRSSSSVSLVEPASVSPPSRLRPRVYVDPFFDSFEIDPLPFSSDHHHHPYNAYHQEC